MSDELMIEIEILTSWILSAFLSFVPNWDLLNSGPPETGTKPGAFFRLPLDTFSPTSELFFHFLTLPTYYCILPTAILGAAPKIAHLWSYQTRFWSYPTRFWSYSNRFWSYPNTFCSYPSRFCPYLGRVLSPLSEVLSQSCEEVSSVRWPVSGLDRKSVV